MENKLFKNCKLLGLLFILIYIKAGFAASVDNKELLDFCDSKYNIFYYTIGGTWEVDLNLTSILVPSFIKDKENFSELMKIEFIKDHSDKIRHLFKDLKGRGFCAHIIGRVNFPLLNNNSETSEVFFAVFDMNGNPSIAFTDNGDGYKSRTIMLATGQDEKNDLLFIQNTNRGMLTYKRA